MWNYPLFGAVPFGPRRIGEFLQLHFVHCSGDANTVS